MDRKLTRNDLAEAFTLMGEMLARTRTVSEIAVYGGSAIMLQMEYRQATEDVDCVVTSGHGPVMQAMIEAGRRLNLPSGWLNEGVSVYTSTHETEADFMPFGQYPSSSRPFLRVTLAKPEYLLAMKMAALERSSERDASDVAHLTSALGIEDVDTAMEVFHRFFPGQDLDLQSKQALRGILANKEMEKTDVDWTPPKPF